MLAGKHQRLAGNNSLQLAEGDDRTGEGDCTNRGAQAHFDQAADGNKVPDAQSGYEKGYTDAIVGLAGANMVYESAGMHASLLGSCMESFVIDNDILGASMRTVRGIEVTDESLSVDVIRQVCTEGPGHFLGHGQTLSLMQREYFYPEVGDRTSPKEWKEIGSTNVVQKARDKVGEILSAHYPSHIDKETDAAIRTEADIKLPREFMRPGNGRW